MGIIPRAQRTTLAAGGDPSAISRASQAFDVVQQGVQVAQAYKQAKDESFVSKTATALQRDVDDFFEQGKIDFQANPDEGLPALKKFTDDRMEELSGGGSESAINALYNVRDSIKQKYVDRWESYSRTQNVKNFTFDLDESARNIALVARNSGKRGEGLEQHMNELDASLMAGTSFLGETDLAQLSRAARDKITEEYLQGVGESNPYSLQEKLRSGQYDLDVDAVQSLEGFAEREIKSRQAQRRVELSPIVNDAIAEAAATGSTDMMPSRDAVISTYGEKRGEQLWAKYEDAVEYGSMMQNIRTMPNSEVQKLLQENEPSGEGFVEESKTYNALVKAASARASHINKDPMGYAQKNFESVSMAYDVAQNAQPENQAEAMQVAIEEGLRAQGELGVPSYKQKIFPDGMANEVANSIERTKPQDKIDMLSGLRQQYGDYWPQAYNELVQAGVPDTTAVLMKMDQVDQRHAAYMLAEASAAGDSLKKAIPKETVKSIDEEVSVNLQEYFTTVMSQAGNTGEIGRMTNAASTLAYQYALKGENAESASKKAVNEIISKKYNTLGTVRVPVSYNSDYVSDGMKDVISFIQDEESIDPRILGSYSGTPDSIIREQYREELKTGGYFITNEKEDGVYLMDKNDFNVVMNKDGTLVPVEVKFSELERMGRKTFSNKTGAFGYNNPLYGQ